jgi:hypothetical protein
VYDAKYGIREHKGGGRASARETAVRVAAGAIAQQILESQNVSIVAYVSSIGGLGMKAIDFEATTEMVDLNLVRCPNTQVASNMLSLIEEVQKEGDYINFYGYSGSCYKCHKNSYGISSYAQTILDSMMNHPERPQDEKYKIEVMEEFTDWDSLINS